MTTVAATAALRIKKRSAVPREERRQEWRQRLRVEDRIEDYLQRPRSGQARRDLNHHRRQDKRQPPPVRTDEQ